MPSSPSQRTPRTTWGNGLPTMPTADHLVAEGISPTTGPGREKKSEVHWCLVMCVHVMSAVMYGGAPAQPSVNHPSITVRHQCGQVCDRRLPKATLLPWVCGPPYSLRCGGQVPDVAVQHNRDARMQHLQSTHLALVGGNGVTAPN